MKLNQRLLAIARFVPKDSSVVDIGTDHALLPIYLLRENIASQVIASDVNPGPLESARRNVDAAGLNDRISLRLGNGLDIVFDGEAEICIIAGMGGSSIRDILRSAGSKGAHFRQIILQPMGSSGTLREWLVENGWEITDEELVAEEERIYEIITVSPGKERTTDPVMVTVGPRLFEKKHHLLKKVVSEEINQNQKILKSLKQTKSESVALKRQALIGRNLALERILKCL